MIEDYEDLFVPRPFWFVEAELLRNLCHAEINAVGQLFAKLPEFRKCFDAPEATIPQRTTCFELLAHRKIIDIIYDTIDQRYEQPPVLSDEQSSTLIRSQNLVSRDAPAWVLETNEVAELLPIRIHRALPEPLHEESFYRNDPAKDEAARSAAEAFSRVEQIQALIQSVFQQQLQRLKERWSTEIARTEIVKTQIVLTPKTTEPKRRRKRDAQRIKREVLIAEIAEVAKTQPEFLQMMDERKVQPQPTWKNWPGSWQQAYKSSILRKLIHQDKSRAVSRVRATRKNNT